MWSSLGLEPRSLSLVRLRLCDDFRDDDECEEIFG